MAAQVLVDELDGCKKYLEWIYYELSSDQMKISGRLLEFLFGMDFKIYRDGGEIEKDDEIRARDALEIRKVYAEEVGQAAGKSARDIDRIWKSIHGKTSVLELIFCICRHLDSMLNEDEETPMTGFFYRILIHNLKLDEFADEDFNVMVLGADTEQLRAECDAEARRRAAEIEGIWSGRVKKWLDRDYFEDGSEGGIFPLENWKPGDKDQKKVSLWYQMNNWIGENLDEEGQFFGRKF